MRIRFRDDESGAAMVEFAIVAALFFIPLIFGIIEFGRVVWAKNMVTAAAREGTRYAVVHGADPQNTSTADSAAVANYVINRTALSPLGVSTVWKHSKMAGDTVTVTVKYSYTPIVKVPGLLTTKNLTGKSTQIVYF
jgi:Flp pilus assembly protein TadG